MSEACVSSIAVTKRLKKGEGSRLQERDISTSRWKTYLILIKLVESMSIIARERNGRLVLNRFVCLFGHTEGGKRMY